MRRTLATFLLALLFPAVALASSQWVIWAWAGYEGHIYFTPYDTATTPHTYNGNTFYVYDPVKQYSGTFADAQADPAHALAAAVDMPIGNLRWPSNRYVFNFAQLDSEDAATQNATIQSITSFIVNRYLCDPSVVNSSRCHVNNHSPALPAFSYTTSSTLYGSYSDSNSGVVFRPYRKAIVTVSDAPACSGSTSTEEWIARAPPGYAGVFLTPKSSADVPHTYGGQTFYVYEAVKIYSGTWDAFMVDSSAEFKKAVDAPIGYTRIPLTRFQFNFAQLASESPDTQAATIQGFRSFVANRYQCTENQVNAAQCHVNNLGVECTGISYTPDGTIYACVHDSNAGFQFFPYLRRTVAITQTDGSATCNSPAPTCSVTLDQNPVARGSGTTLRWSSSNADSMYINSVGYVSGSGASLVQPSQTTNYDGTAKGPGGTISCPRTLVVGPSCTPSYSCSGNGVRNSCTGEVTQCSLGQICSGAQCVVAQCTPALSCVGNAVHNSCTKADTPCSAYYTCANGACIPPKSISFAAFSATDQNGSFTATGHLQVRPALVRKNSTTQVYWNAQNVSSCSVTGTNGDSWTGVFSGVPGKASSAIEYQTTFTLFCSALPGATPSSITEHQTVNILPTFNEP